MFKKILVASAFVLSVTSTAFAAPVKEGVTAPGFTLPALKNVDSGSKLSLENYLGEVVYIDFWASWCGPCRQSLPVLNELRAKYHEKGFEVLAVNIDEDVSDAEGFLKQYPVTYPILSDPESSLPGVYQPPGMPTAYLVDKKGVVRYVHEGFNKGDEKEIEEHIQALLAE